jgi:hypothetical protein
MPTQWFRMAARWPRLLVLVMGLVVVMPAPAASAQAVLDVQGQWDGTLLVTSGPGAGLSDACSTTITQDGFDLAGVGACAAVGSGGCNGAYSPLIAEMRLVCVSPIQGTRAVRASISEDGTTATGTWTASNGSSGSYLATRPLAPDEPFTDPALSPDPAP